MAVYPLPVGALSQVSDQDISPGLQTPETLPSQSAGEQHSQQATGQTDR